MMCSERTVKELTLQRADMMCSERTVKVPALQRADMEKKAHNINRPSRPYLQGLLYLSHLIREFMYLEG